MRTEILIAAACLVGGCVLAADKGDPVSRKLPDAIAIEQVVARGGRQSLWPGFEPEAVPLAIFDGNGTYLFRHPSPPDGYIPLPGYSNAFRKEGRDAAITANTNAELGGVSTATLMLNPEHPRESIDKMAAVAIHEAFHVYQRAHHASWIGNEADLFTYPLENADLLALRRQETLGLRFALDANNADMRGCWIRTALEARRSRFASMEDKFAAYERGTELNEGLATYIQHRAEGSTTVDLPQGDFVLQSVRQRAYATGLTLAVLLDQTKPGWPAALENNDAQTLDGMLLAAVGDGRACSIDAGVVWQMEEKAKRDVVALQAEHLDALKIFETSLGWRVRVVAANGKPLWPQGFDPLNLERLTKDRILHTRFVKVGNDSGQVEILGQHALTVAAGSHPLFEGIRMIEVASLPSKPKIHSDGTTVSLAGDGVELNFKDALVRQKGNTSTIKLRSSKSQK